jgi:hypothetical protein
MAGGTTTNALKAGLITRLGRRMANAVPAPGLVLAGSTLWGLVMAVSVLASLTLEHGAYMTDALAVFLLYFIGAAAAFAPILFVLGLVFGHKGSGTARFVVALLLCFLATHTVTAGLFALQYRMFYAHWHAPFLSRIWFFQFAYTSAGALYQFTVSSLMLYLPFAWAGFLGFALWFRRRAH